MEGAAFLTKADTMARADRSGLTSKPGAIYGARSHERSRCQSRMGFNAVIHSSG